MSKSILGQYFTTNETLQEKLHSFIQNDPKIILEPCIGQGDLIKYISNKNPYILFDMYEIDSTIDLLKGVDKKSVKYCNFLSEEIHKTYKTIVGNPPYIRTKKGNLYIDFIEKCFHLLEDKGELIFIVPSDVFKLTSASKLLDEMMNSGTFTHVYHPHDEKLFIDASVDIVIFRYYKDITDDRLTLYNDKQLYIKNNSGLITFTETIDDQCYLFSKYFDVYVGLVSGKENVYKNERLGNLNILISYGEECKYIYIDKYPCGNKEIDTYLHQYKDELLSRKIRKFTEKNWFEWGAPRNISIMEKHKGEKCIYMYNLTRKNNVAFAGQVQPFGAGLIMLKPKKEMDLQKIIEYLNSKQFKENFMYSGRFKIGHRQISYSTLPTQYLNYVCLT